ncbi:MAG: hypothetical protein GY769_25280 [bacterium]|nr:hypothetical protein [bacterium]
MIDGRIAKYEILEALGKGSLLARIGFFISRRKLGRVVRPVRVHALNPPLLHGLYDERQIVELTSTLAWENCRTRFAHALDFEAEGFSEGAYCPLREVEPCSLGCQGNTEPLDLGPAENRPPDLLSDRGGAGRYAGPTPSGVAAVSLHQHAGGCPRGTSLVEDGQRDVCRCPNGAPRAHRGRSRRRVRIGRALGRRTGALLLLLGGFLAPAGVVAQDAIVPLQFSFSDPGARSMGFGGAFVALADDATAAFANPAGLVQLVKPEVSIEGRSWSYSTPFTERGRVENLPSGFGIDTMVGLRTARSEDSLTGLSFLSLAYPKGRWSLAVFRHQLANFEFSGETQGLFGGGTDRFQERFFDQRMSADLDFVSYGVSGAYRINERFNIGFGVTYHDSSLVSQATMYLPDEYPENPLGPTSYLPERALLTQTIFGDGTDWALIGGFLWRLSDSWRIGGVYRQGPEAGIAVELAAGQAFDPAVPPGEVLARIDGLSVEFPPALGLGFAYRAPDGGLTVSFQWDHIEYSTIVESLELEDQALADADELHLGGEYVFLGSTPIVAVRVGAWLDPDHQLEDTSDDLFIRALERGGEDQTHYALGLGVALASFQIDLGVDFADTVDTVSLSAIYSF